MFDDVCGHDSVHVLAGRFVTDLVNECERITCPGETMEGLFFPTTESNTTRVLPCAEGAVGSGYARVCDENGVWSKTMEGECSGPAEVVHHSDGNMYLMEESGERDVRREHDGYVWRSWSTVRQVVCDPQHVQACASAFSVRRSS